MVIIPTGKAQVNLIFTGNGYTRGAQIAIGIDNTPPLTAADLAGTVGGLWVASVMPFLGSACNLATVKAKLGPNDTGAEATVAIGVNGTLSGNTLPPQVAALARKVTVLGSRKHTGKMFIPGVTEAQTDGAGQLTSGALSDLQGGLDDFFDALDSGNVPMLLLHSDSTTPDAVTGLTLFQLMASQRRRIRKVGSRRSTP